MPDDAAENTYVIDAENAAEMARLVNQDRLMTRAMGGLFPERADLSDIHDVLDIGCGPGGWALDMAQAYPHLRVTGIDISQLMIEYARSHVLKRNVQNVQFRVMNALRPLEFADASFDLVNARYISGFMSPSTWPELLRECGRILRPGGIIRLIEGEAPVTTSVSQSRWWSLLAQAGKISGRSFSVDGSTIGITPMLGRLLRNAGYVNIYEAPHMMNFSAGMEAHTGVYQDYMVAFKLIQPFLVLLGLVTQEEAEVLYHRVLAEMQSEDFCGIGFFLAVTGEKTR